LEEEMGAFFFKVIIALFVSVKAISLKGASSVLNFSVSASVKSDVRAGADAEEAGSFVIVTSSPSVLHAVKAMVIVNMDK
jgi:hypothetical protein